MWNTPINTIPPGRVKLPSSSIYCCRASSPAWLMSWTVCRKCSTLTVCLVGLQLWTYFHHMSGYSGQSCRRCSGVILGTPELLVAEYLGAGGKVSRGRWQSLSGPFGEVVLWVSLWCSGRLAPAWAPQTCCVVDNSLSPLKMLWCDEAYAVPFVI